MLTFLVVIGASFAIMASILTGMVSSTLYQQRTRQATRSLEQLASSAAPFLASAQMDSLSELLTAQAGELGGRLLAVDMDGKVQADTFGARSGQRLSIPETVAVLLHGEKSAFGIHRVDSESGVSYVAVASAVMEVSGKTLGALVLFLPVDELQTALETVKRQLMTVFLIVAGAAMAAALMLSGCSPPGQGADADNSPHGQGRPVRACERPHIRRTQGAGGKLQCDGGAD